jgi:hypothetical protein
MPQKCVTHVSERLLPMSLVYTPPPVGAILLKYRASHDQFISSMPVHFRVLV